MNEDARGGRRRLKFTLLAGTGIVAAVLAAVSVTTGAKNDDIAQHVREAIRGGRARYVMLFIGDGMGDSEITIARNYQVGANGRLWMDTLPLTGVYTTYAVQKANPSKPDYVTDSAASGSG